MRRRAAIAAALLLAFSLSACSDQDEVAKQEQIQQQITVVQHELTEVTQSHRELQARVTRLRELLADADLELARSDARVFGINRIIPSLKELTQYGFGESPAHYVALNPALGPNVLFTTMLFLLFLWLMWRVRTRQLEKAMSAEIDRVIRRLSAEANTASRQGAKGDASGPREIRRPAPATSAAAAKAPPAAAPKAPAAAVEKSPPPAEKAVIEKPRAPKPVSEKPAEIKTAAEKSGPHRAAGAKAKPRQSPVKKRENPPAAKKCKVKGCNNKHRSKGLCNKHYQQWRKGALHQETDED